MTNRSGTVAARSYLTAGIAALGIGAMTLAPVQPLPDQIANPPRLVSDLGTAVLASSFDPITPWVDTITTSIANIGALIGFALDKPFPILQTVIANIGTYFGELTSGNAGLIPGQIFDNIGKLFTAPFDAGQTLQAPIGPEGSGNTIPITLGTYVSETEPGGFSSNSQGTLNSTISQIIATNVLIDPETGGENVACQIDGECGFYPTLASAAEFLNTYASGVLLGLLGPVLSPVAALINSVTAIVGFVSDGDFIGAINEIVNIPANLVNGFLNGALLDLTPLLGAFGEDLPLDGVGFRLGGLLSGPMPLNGTLDDPGNPPTEFSGGTGMDSLYVVRGTGEEATDFPGLPIGPIGSLIGMGQYLGNALVVTPPAAQTAAAAQAAAPVEAAAVEPPAAVAESAPPALAEDAEAVAPSVAEVQEAEADNDAGTPSRAKARAARNAPAATDADSGSSRKSTTRGAAANRR